MRKSNLCSNKWDCLKIILHMYGKFWLYKWQFHVMHNFWITGYAPLETTPFFHACTNFICQ